MNPLGFRTVGFREWPLVDCLRILAEIGYDGVELCLEHPDCRPETMSPARGAQVAAQVAAAGLEMASVSYHGDTDEHAARRENQVAAVDIAAAAGARVLILNGQKALPGDQSRQRTEFLDLLRSRLLPAAQAQDIQIALEPEPGHWLHSSLELLDLLAEVDHPLLGANLDLGHAWLTDRDLPQTLRDLAPRLWHLHWEDFPAGEHRHLVPGEGDMPLTDLHGVLQDVGYRGYYTLDLFNITADPAGAARACWAAMQPFLGPGD